MNMEEEFHRDRHPRADEYTKQIQTMRDNAKRWRAEHPDTQALVQFNYPPRAVMMIAPISAAVENGIITTNDAGLELLKALWPWDAATEPTCTMVLIALETPCKPPLC